MLDLAVKEQDVEYVHLKAHDQQHREADGALADDAVDERDLIAPGLHRIPGVALHALLGPAAELELAQGVQGADGNLCDKRCGNDA